MWAARSRTSRPGSRWDRRIADLPTVRKLTETTIFGRGGLGGQFLLIAPVARVVMLFSVLENEDAPNRDYQLETIAMAEAITRLPFDT